MPANFVDNPNCPSNFLSGVGFQLKINKLPGVSFFCQNANVPSMDLAVATQATRWNRLPEPGDEVNYGDLTVRFMVTEDMKNYLAIHNWIRYLGHPESSKDWTIYSDGDTYDEKTYSDGFLIILDSNFNPKFRIKFYDLFPTSLGGLNFNSTATDTEYLSVDASFKYSIYDIEEVGAPGFFTESDYAAPIVSLFHSIGEDNLTLTYYSANAQYLIIDQGIGEVPINNGYGVVTKSAALKSGINGVVTYTITAVGRGGTATASTTITIGIPQTNQNRLCIAVVDENTRTGESGMELKWTSFRATYPDRPFYLLQPSTCTDLEVLATPVSFLEETDSTTITNLCVSPVINGFQDEKFGAYRSTSERTVEVAPLNNIIRETTLDNIDNYGVFRMGLEQACGNLSDIIALLQNNTTLTKVLNYINGGGVLWLNSEWVGGGCANHPNTNTILNLLGSSIDIIGDSGTIGNMQRSNVQEVIDAEFPEILYHNASGIFSGGVPIYQYNGKNTFVYERIGNGILTVSADINTYTNNPNNPYTLLPPQELYRAFRNLVLN
jgi:hypothetical protein